MTARRILIVDDSDLIRQIVKAHLEGDAGWEVVEAGSGYAGLACARSRLPDAILLDVMLPDLDGPEVFRELRANAATRDVPVIFLTAADTPADRRRLSDLGAAAVIAKPFNPLTVADQIAGALGWDR